MIISSSQGFAIAPKIGFSSKTKARLIEKIADLVRNKKLEGISDLRDESAKNEIRIVIEIKRGDSGEIVLNNLYKLTQMQISFGMNLVSLVNGLPKQLGLKEILSEFYKHRREVILRRIVGRDKTMRHCFPWDIRDVEVRPDFT